MPPSVLAKLSHLDIVYPLLFKLTNTRSKRVTHTGVLEFVAEEKKIYLPSWLMKNLDVNDGETLVVENTSLPVAKYSRFQPLSVNFLDITNPKAVLENYLRQFACLTTGDVLSINYNDKIYELRVLETRPSFAVNIIECDMSVDFEAPEGYKETTLTPEVDPTESIEFVPFTGRGNRLDGKTRKRKNEDADDSVDGRNKKPKRSRGIPDYGYAVGSVDFMRDSQPPPAKTEEPVAFKAFNGKGCTMISPSVEASDESDVD